MFRKILIGSLLFSSQAFSLIGPPQREVLEAAGILSPEICFSPIQACDQKLALFIAGATKSLDIAVYDINIESVVSGIIAQSKRLPVRIVVDLRQSKGAHSAVSKLIAAGVNVRFGHQAGIMHNKFTLRDGEALETGSFNYTRHAAFANNENQIYLYDPEVVSTYQNRFEQIWALANTPAEQAAKPKRHKG